MYLITYECSACTPAFLKRASDPIIEGCDHHVAADPGLRTFWRSAASVLCCWQSPTVWLAYPSAWVHITLHLPIFVFGLTGSLFKSSNLTWSLISGLPYDTCFFLVHSFCFLLAWREGIPLLNLRFTIPLRHAPKSGKGTSPNGFCLVVPSKHPQAQSHSCPISKLLLEWLLFKDESISPMLTDPCTCLIQYLIHG